MKHTLLRKTGALLGAVMLFAACSKKAQMSDITNEGAQHQKVRVTDGPRVFPPAPMPADSIELEQTDNPQDM